VLIGVARPPCSAEKRPVREAVRVEFRVRTVDGPPRRIRVSRAGASGLGRPHERRPNGRCLGRPRAAWRRRQTGSADRTGAPGWHAGQSAGTNACRGPGFSGGPGRMSGAGGGAAGTGVSAPRPPGPRSGGRDNIPGRPAARGLEEEWPDEARARRRRGPAQNRNGIIERRLGGRFIEEKRRAESRNCT